MVRKQSLAPNAPIQRAHIGGGLWREPASADQDARLDAKSLRELFHDADGRISGATFEIADVRTMNLCLKRKLLLRQSFFLSQAAQVTAKAFADIHAAN